MEKIDRRKKYILIIDTETANTKKTDMSHALVYDIGYQIVDKLGNVYKRESFINGDIFISEFKLMSSAYYKEKIPNYIVDLSAGTRKLSTTLEIRDKMLQDMEKYNIDTVAAHNAYFDLNALNCTLRYVTKSAERYWFPFDTIFWDTMRMAESTICKMKTYQDFCSEYDYYTKNGRVRKTAEILYRFITNNPDFEEAHTGLEDVTIEAQIMAYCLNKHTSIKKELFSNREPKEPMTYFQKMLIHSIKEVPLINI